MSLNNQHLFLQIITIATIFITGCRASACNFSVQLDQYLFDGGFHRNVSYHVNFDGMLKDRRMYQDCILALDQSLPPGVYVNPDELADLMRLRKLNAIPKKKVNIELLAEFAETSGLYIINKINLDTVHVSFPVHARYHMAVAGGGSARNEILPPRMYLRCPDKRLDLCDNGSMPTVKFFCDGNSKEKCRWKEIPFDVMTDTLVWYVPVGDTNHYYFVAFTNALTIAFGSLHLLVTILKQKLAEQSKRF